MRISGRSIRHRMLQSNSNLRQEKTAALDTVSQWAQTLSKDARLQLGDLICQLTVALRSRYSGLTNDKDRGPFAKSLDDDDNLTIESILEVLLQIDNPARPDAQLITDDQKQFLSSIADKLAIICTQRHTTLTPVARLTQTGKILLEKINYPKKEAPKTLLAINRDFKNSIVQGGNMSGTHLLAKGKMNYYLGRPRQIDSLVIAPLETLESKIKALQPQVIRSALDARAAQVPEIHRHFLHFIWEASLKSTKLSHDEVHIYAACLGLTDRQISAIGDVINQGRPFFSLWFQRAICAPITNMLTEMGYTTQQIETFGSREGLLSTLVTYNLTHDPNFQLPNLTKTSELSVDLTNMNLSGKRLCRLHFKKSSFQNANLKDADFSYTTLNVSALAGADLSQTRFKDAHIIVDDINPNNLKSIIESISSISEQDYHELKKNVLCNIFRHLRDPEAFPQPSRTHALYDCQMALVSWITQNPAYSNEHEVVQFVKKHLLIGLLVDDAGHEIIHTNRDNIPLPSTLSFVYLAANGRARWPWFYHTFASSVNQIVCAYKNHPDPHIAKDALTLQSKYLKSLPREIREKLEPQVGLLRSGQADHIILPCLKDAYICVSTDYYEQRVFSKKPQVGWNQFYYFTKNEAGLYVMSSSMNISYAALFHSIPVFKEIYHVSRKGDAKLLELFSRLGLDEFIPELKMAIEFPYYDGRKFNFFWPRFVTKHAINPNQKFLANENHIQDIINRFTHISPEYFSQFIRQNTGIYPDVPILDQYGYLSPAVDQWLNERFDPYGRKISAQENDTSLLNMQFIQAYERHILIMTLYDEFKEKVALKTKELEDRYKDLPEEDRKRLIQIETKEYSSKIYRSPHKNPSPKPEPTRRQRLNFECFQTYLTPKGWDLVQDIFLHDKSLSPAGILRSLAAVFTQLSSFTFFGEESKSIEAFRYFAIVCFNTSFQFEYPTETDLEAFQKLRSWDQCAAKNADVLIRAYFKRYPAEIHMVLPLVWQYE